MQINGESTFHRARTETIRYHEELYASVDLGDAGSWLSRSHRLLQEALDAIPMNRPVVAYDLGCGIGRHTIPMLEQLPVGSQVYAIDLLQSALTKLEPSVPRDTRSRLHLRRADLAEFVFEEPADLILAFSVVEHLPDETAIRGLFKRIHAALLPGGVFGVGIVADRYEVDGAGRTRPGLLESGISSVGAQALLADVFGSYQVVAESVRPAQAREARDGTEYVLNSTLVAAVLRSDCLAPSADRRKGSQRRVGPATTRREPLPPRDRSGEPPTLRLP